MKSFALIFFALCIDGLQAALAAVFFVLQFATPVGGGLTVGLASAGYCWDASSGVWALIKTAACIGAFATGGGVASAFAIPIGAAVDVVISITLGGVLVMALAWMGMFYQGTVLGAFLGESIPFLDVLPGWTLMTWRCISKKNAEEKDKRKGFSGSMPGVTLQNLPGREDSALEKAQWAAGVVNRSRQRPIDGIRHA